jgi:hypothetical protein
MSPACAGEDRDGGVDPTSTSRPLPGQMRGHLPPPNPAFTLAGARHCDPNPFLAWRVARRGRLI